jgi:hypothetical protein
VAIERCTFIDNEAVAEGGGGISLFGVTWSTTIRDNVFIRCRATGPYAVGGGAWVGACPVDIAGNTFEDCGIVSGRGGAALDAGGCFVQTEFGNNVFADSEGGPAVVVSATTTVPSSCNVFWNNADGDYEGLELSSTDRLVDPLFCDPSMDDLRLAGDSPCLPANSAGCGRIGALGHGCGPVSLESRSWGSIKAIYR